MSFYKIGFRDKLRLEGESEAQDILDRKRRSQGGPYAKFIPHLELVFTNVESAMNFLNNIDTMKKF